MAHVLPPEHDPAMDDMPCQDCGGFDFDACWEECPECLGRGYCYEVGDGINEPSEYTATCRRCGGVGGWCADNRPEAQAVRE